MTIRPIRSSADYNAALSRVRDLMDRKDQKSIDELDILQALVEKWERKHYAMEAATPADAIKFRMAQAELKPRDLIPYLGTKSRVSEILSGLRQPTIDQIRALNQHLGIPVDSLIGQIKHEPVTRSSTAALAAVSKLRTLGEIKTKEGIGSFIARATKVAPAVAMLRKTRSERTNAKTDFQALEAWCAAVLLKADSVKLPKTVDSSRGPREARELAKLSIEKDWPLLARQFLADLGIIFVALERLPGTFLDGAAMCRRDGAPVIALTLRHDRIDNFWFTLLHEFAHVCCHLTSRVSVIFDDLEVRSSDAMEMEADEFARNALIPKRLWQARVSPDMSSEEVKQLATEAGVHPAIVAGRWRYENSDYRRFTQLLGRGEIRSQIAR